MVVNKELREMIIQRIQDVPVPSGLSVEDAYKLGVRRAIEARIRIDGIDDNVETPKLEGG